MFSALLKEYNQINNIYNIKRSGRCKGILQYPGGNHIASYAWGLGNVSNNIVRDYSLWKGVQIATKERITKIVIFGDSMIVIREVINRLKMGNNALNILISRILNTPSGFEEVSIFHIKCNLNSKVDYQEKLASHLSLQTYIKNGILAFLPIP